MLELYAPYVSGSVEVLALVASSKSLSKEACEAFVKSLVRLGYSCERIAFVTCTPKGAEQPAAESAPVALGASELYTIVEGLDPLSMIVADAEAAALLTQAYREQLTPDTYTRLLGRPCVVLASFERALADPAKKQIAWSLLKQLPRFA